MESTKQLQKVSSIMKHIHGPFLDDITAEDIEGTDDREAAQLLLKWLAAQVPDLYATSGESVLVDGQGNGGEERDRHMRAALRAIALESDEVSRYKRIDDTYTESTSDGCKNLVEYIPQSEARKRSEHVQKEVELAQREVDLLRSRISQTKQASQKMSKLTKQIQRAVYDLDSKARSSEDRLSELSVNVDTTISSTVAESNALLTDLTSSLCKDNQGCSKKNVDLDIARTYLGTVKKYLSAITSALRDDEQGLATLRQEVAVRLDDLNQQAVRLRKAFASISCPHSLSPRRLNDLEKKELLGLCLALEHDTALQGQGGANDNVLAALLDELDEGITSFTDPAMLDVDSILRDAWALDEVVLLRSEERSLDQALASLDNALEPLERIQSSFSQLPLYMEEAEALIEAFGEEIGGINLNNVPESEEIAQARRSREDWEMERELKRVLNENKDVRRQSAPPMLLLTREDVLEELRSLKTRQADLEVSEKCVAGDVARRCSTRPLNYTLPQIYADSLLNTSPPFEFPAAVKELEARTRRRTFGLHNLASNLEEDVREAFAKSSNTKRLDGFIEKWGGG